MLELGLASARLFKATGSVAVVSGGAVHLASAGRTEGNADAIFLCLLLNR
jgi:hypothetical protein